MKYLQFLSLIFILFSCNTSEEKKLPEEQEEVFVDDTVAMAKPGYDPETKLYVWKSEYDYTKTRNPAADNSILTTDSLIKGLNQLYENIYLEKVKQSNDTLYTRIDDSQFLTQQMGSTGAEIYVADVVLNLTEVPGVRYVSIDLKPGDHMQPGTWSRENFDKYKTVK